jgi:hypothetical protein
VSLALLLFSVPPVCPSHSCSEEVVLSSDSVFHGESYVLSCMPNRTNYILLVLVASSTGPLARRVGTGAQYQFGTVMNMNELKLFEPPHRDFMRRSRAGADQTLVGRCPAQVPTGQRDV